MKPREAGARKRKKMPLRAVVSNGSRGNHGGVLCMGKGDGRPGHAFGEANAFCRQGIHLGDE